MSSIIFGGVLGVLFRVGIEHYWEKVLDRGETPFMLSYLFIVVGGALGGLLGAVIKF